MSTSPNTATSWRDAIRAPRRLVAGEVHVWRFDLDALPREIGDMPHAPETLARAARFRRPQLAARHLAARAALRWSIARYLPSGAEIVLRPDIRGKVELLGAGRNPVHTSLSHAGSMALVAVASDRPVGVDVEHIATGPDLAALEWAFGRTLHAGCPRAHALQMSCAWTRVEAYLKALGTGFDHPLALGPAALAVLDPWEPHLAADWSVFPLWPGARLVGALACARGGRIEVRTYDACNGAAPTDGLLSGPGSRSLA